MNKAKLFAGCVLFALLSIISHNITQTEASYHDIADLHLTSFGVTEKKDVNIKSEQAKKNKPSLNVKELSKHERRIKVFKLLIHSEVNTYPESIKANHLLRELEVFYGHGENPKENLFSHIDRTSTSFGEAELAHILSNPTSNTVQIKQRQELVKELLENKKLRTAVEEILQAVSSNEAAFLANWEEDDTLTKEAIESLYFGKYLSYLNNSPHALEARVRLNNLKLCVTTLIDPFLFACPAYLQNREAGYLSALKETLAACKDAYNPFAYIKKYNDSFTEEYKQNFIQNVEAHVQQQEAILRSMSGNPDLRVTRPSEREIADGLRLTQKIMPYSLATMAVFTAIYTYTKFNNTNNAFTLASNQHRGHIYLQTKLLGLARILHATEDIASLINDNEILKDGLVHSEIIETLLHNDDVDLQAFISTLRTKTFKGSSSFFSRMGRVLATAKQAETLKDNLIPLIKVIGELDACLSIAKLFEAHNASDARYCFVEFEQKGTPHICLESFWHPFVGKDNIVTNSIELGIENKERNIILTGSNTGGKSTLLKAIGINLLLAHTIGITPSGTAVITPFEVITTSLNLSDDTAAGISLFKAEVNRAKDIMNQISEISDNAYAFLIIDEMFTGTNAKNGADAALAFAGNLSSYNNVMYTFATHFPLVTTLESEGNGVCANYCMDIHKGEDGSLQPTYKLTSGISIQNVAEDILKKELGGFIDGRTT